MILKQVAKALASLRICDDSLESSLFDNAIIVGEPKSRIVQKHTFFAPERYTAGILYSDSLNSA